MAFAFGEGDWFANLRDKSGASEVNQFMLAFSELMYFDKVPKTENSLSLPANGEWSCQTSRRLPRDLYADCSSAFSHPIKSSCISLSLFFSDSRHVRSLDGVWRQTPKSIKKISGVLHQRFSRYRLLVWWRHGKRRFRPDTAVVSSGRDRFLSGWIQWLLQTKWWGDRGKSICISLLPLTGIPIENCVK